MFYVLIVKELNPSISEGARVDILGLMKVGQRDIFCLESLTPDDSSRESETGSVCTYFISHIPSVTTR